MIVLLYCTHEIEQFHESARINQYECSENGCHILIDPSVFANDVLLFCALTSTKWSSDSREVIVSCNYAHQLLSVVPETNYPRDRHTTHESVTHLLYFCVCILLIHLLYRHNRKLEYSSGWQWMRIKSLEPSPERKKQEKIDNLKERRCWSEINHRASIELQKLWK